MAKKYIDAEKLEESLKRRYTDITVPVITSEGGLESYFRRREIRDIIKLIDSLQQEQPKEICHKCIHHGKDDDYCYNPHGGMQRLINENGVYECTGFYEKEEQPEVDIEKEVADYWTATGWCQIMTLSKFKVIARYFYGLGLNAKEENK